MSRAEWFEPKWRWLKRFALAGLGGALMIAAGFFAGQSAIVMAGCLPLIPLVFWLAFIPILHWKDRYVGTSSGVWGAFPVFETSSWSKAIYWFVHVMPDWRKLSQYADVP